MFHVRISSLTHLVERCEKRVLRTCLRTVLEGVELGVQMLAVVASILVFRECWLEVERSHGTLR